MYPDMTIHTDKNTRNRAIRHFVIAVRDRIGDVLVGRPKEIDTDTLQYAAQLGWVLTLATKLGIELPLVETAEVLVDVNSKVALRDAFTRGLRDYNSMHPA